MGTHGYIGKVKRGYIEIISIRGPKGFSYVTLENILGRDKDHRTHVDQVKSYLNATPDEWQTKKDSVSSTEFANKYMETEEVEFWNDADVSRMIEITRDFINENVEGAAYSDRPWGEEGAFLYICSLLGVTHFESTEQLLDDHSISVHSGTPIGIFFYNRLMGGENGERDYELAQKWAELIELGGYSLASPHSGRYSVAKRRLARLDKSARR